MSPQKRRGKPPRTERAAEVEPVDDPVDPVDAPDPVDPAEGSDDPEPESVESGPDAAAAVTPPRTGSAAAAAAARARRIGGRPTTVRPSRREESDDAARTGQPAGTDQPAKVQSSSTTTSSTKTAESAGSVSITKRRSELAGPDDESGSADKPAEESSAGWLVVKLARKSRKSSEPAPDAANVAAAKPADQPPRRPGTLVRWAPAAVLIVAAIVMAIVVAVSTHGKRWDKPSSNSERDQVLAAAKMCIVDTNSYNYKKIDAFAKKGSDCASGKFAQQFTKTVNDVIRKNAPKTKQIQNLQVNTAGIMNVTDDNQWDVLVYGQLSVSNTASSNGEVDPFASVARLADIKGKWRITNLCTAQFNGPINACY